MQDHTDAACYVDMRLNAHISTRAEYEEMYRRSIEVSFWKHDAPAVRAGDPRRRSAVTACLCPCTQSRALVQAPHSCLARDVQKSWHGSCAVAPTLNVHNPSRR